VRLFKADYVPTVNTVLADLEANEADYSDYAPQTITAWLPPSSSVFGGAQILAPTVQFLCVDAQAVENAIGGYWIETATGDVVLIRQFDSPVAMVSNGDVVQITPVYVFPTGV
jgi:hypothetical protein